MMINSIASTPRWEALVKQPTSLAQGVLLLTSIKIQNRNFDIVIISPTSQTTDTIFNRSLIGVKISESRTTGKTLSRI